MTSEPGPPAAKDRLDGMTFKLLTFASAISIIIFELWLLSEWVDTKSVSSTEFLKLVALTSGFPVLVMLAMYDKIEKQTAGIILTAIVSFALGQASTDKSTSGYHPPDSLNQAETGKSKAQG